jgi:hypothetical protein
MVIRATVSGSFHRHMTAVAEAVGNLRSLGVDVLSPADPRVVDADGDFLFVASDVLRSRRLVEDRHLEAIRASHFLWVVCPDGYTGPSTSGEILAATVLGKPVFSLDPALDLGIGDYVQRVPSMANVVHSIALGPAGILEPSHVLLAPEELADTAARLDGLRECLTGRRGNRISDPEWQIASIREELRSKFGFRLPH